MQRTTDETARERLCGNRWTQFDAWQDGNVQFWLDDDGEVVAYLRYDDQDQDGIAFFEVRDKGCGIGSRLVREVQAERPGLYISGELDSADCARFWHRLGLVADDTILFDGTVVQF